MALGASPAVAVLLSACALAGCATPGSASLEDRTLTVDCGDVVLVGRLTNKDYALIADGGDVLGHGRIAATLRVQRVVRGPRTPAAVQVLYVAHTYLREDRDFMVVAQQANDGTYVIKRARVMSIRPRLDQRCG